MSAIRSRVTTRLAAAAAGIVAFLGAAVLWGWTFRIASLKTIVPNTLQMAPSTALCLVLLGASLWAEAYRVRSGAGLSWLSRAGAALAGLTGVAKLIEYAAGRSLGVDALLFSHDPQPTQMAAATAFTFVLSAAALLLARSRFVNIYQLLCLLGGLLSWLGLSQYVYGGDPLVPLAKMAVLTAGAFMVLNAGILCLRCDTGLMKLLVSRSPGGGVARRLIPAALLVPVIIGWLRIEAQRAGWFGTEAGVSLVALSNILVFGALIWWNAALLDHADAQRGLAERGVHAQLERLHLLQEITRAIGDRQDMQSIFQATMQRLEDHLGIDFCCVCLYDAAAKEMTVAAFGPKGENLALPIGMVRGTSVALTQNGLSRCLLGQLICEPDASLVPFPLPQRLAQAGLRALVAAPLLVDSEVFGLIVVARKQAGSFSSGECEFLAQLSQQVALAAHQAELHTALRRAYDDLRATQDAVMQQERLRALGQMASGIAHDINNAVSPVSLYTDILLEQEQNLSDRTRHYLEITQRAIGDVSQTIGRMREFYRHAEITVQFQPTDLNLMIRQVVDLTRARWSDMPQQRGIVIHVDQELAPDLPPISGVESEIREALTNLIFNAVDAMPAGGRLTLRTIAPPSRIGLAARKVLLEVSDTGAGMDEDTRRRCLEPFFTTKGERGTGLGLAMVYGTIRRHQADLEIESEPGRGTTLRLVFPRALAEETALVPAAAVLPARRRILVVDDDPLVIKSLRAVLEEDGHSVLTAAGGQEGIDAFQAAQDDLHRFALVITDLGMPYVDGRRVAAAVKAASPATPVIMLTGWGQRLSEDREVPQHVDCVLNKPPKLRELREALVRLGESQSAG